MRGSGFPTKGKTRDTSLSCLKFRCHSHVKKLSPHSFFDVSLCPFFDRTPYIGKNVSLMVFRQIWLKHLPVVHIFSFTTMTYSIKFIGMKSINTKQCPARLSLELYLPVSSLLKNAPSFSLTLFLQQLWTGLFLPPNHCRKLWIWGNNQISPKQDRGNISMIVMCVWIFRCICYWFKVSCHKFHTKQVYNVQPNFIQCSNGKNYGVKISLFLCVVRILDLRCKSS